MKRSLNLIVLSLWVIAQLTICNVVYAGGGGGDDQSPQQQTVTPQTKVVVVTPPVEETETSDWALPIVLATIGAGGAIGASWVAVRRRSG